jgi:hypothetical protein
VHAATSRVSASKRLVKINPFIFPFTFKRHPLTPQFCVWKRSAVAMFQDSDHDSLEENIEGLIDHLPWSPCRTRSR